MWATSNGRSISYRTTFGFEEIGRDPERPVILRVGRDVLLLFHAETARIPSGGIPAKEATGDMHVAFKTTPDSLDAWRTHLRSLGIPIETEVEWPRGGRSLYIRDPDRHSIELVTRGIWGF